jgi:aspartate/methionine/tyrosine aminotransferase
MFSARTGWQAAENRVSRAFRERRRLGLPVLDLTESNPTRVGLKAPPDLIRLLGDPGSDGYDPAPLGWPPARESVARDYARRGAPVPPERVALTASSSEGYAFLLKLLCDPGDRILVPSPSYPLFDYLASLESVEVVRYPLRYAGEWHVDLAALEPIPERTRAMVLVSPNNPTGSILKEDEVGAIQGLAKRHDFAVISDEVFADFVFRRSPGQVSTLAAQDEVLTFCLGGLSKCCGLPQLKLGWLTAGGPGPAVAEALSRLEVIADTYLSVGTPVQRALPRILEQLALLQDPIQRRLASNLERLRGLVRGSALTLLPPEGGWSAILRLPDTRPEEEWTLSLLEKDGILVHPGFFFDLENGVFLVVSLLCREEDLEYGVGIIRDRVG